MARCTRLALAAIGITLVACTSGLPGVGTFTPEPPGTPTPATGPPEATTAAPAPVATATAGQTTEEATASGKPLSAPATLPPSPARPAVVEFAEPPERDLYQLAVELAQVGRGEVQRVVNPTPPAHTEGRRDTFWLVDLPGLKVYQSQFELRLVTSHAYWYVEDGQSLRQDAIELAAAGFEEEIYPRVTAVFGEEWSPGVDNDPHLNILNARLPGLGGYYSASDEYPAGVSKYSNQREIIYINSEATPVGSPSYQEVPAHELQHAVHWNADPSEETWVNEGLSELSTSIRRPHLVQIAATSAAGQCSWESSNLSDRRQSSDPVVNPLNNDPRRQSDLGIGSWSRVELSLKHALAVLVAARWTNPATMANLSRVVDSLVRSAVPVH